MEQSLKTELTPEMLAQREADAARRRAWRAEAKALAAKARELSAGDLSKLSAGVLDALNDLLEAEQDAVRQFRRTVLVPARNAVLRRDQLLSRYKGKLKPEDIDALKQLAAEGTVVKPGVAEVAGAAVHAGLPV